MLAAGTSRQILSIMTGSASLAAVREYIPGLLQYRYTEANLQSLQHCIGTPVPKQPAARLLVDETQLDHFLQFITSPHIVQDLSFGEKSLRLSNGSMLEVPNVIQALIPERITCQYKQYFQEVGFIPFSQRTMLRILSACSATVRKSLQGLDYVAADGASAFDDLAKMLQQHSPLVSVSTLGKVAEDSEEWKALPKGRLQGKGNFK